MSRVVSASPPTTIFSSIKQSKTQRIHFISSNPSPSVAVPRTNLSSPHLNLESHSFGCTGLPQRNSFYCRSRTGPGSPGSGDGESRSVLDAFFLGKALAEALNERIESTIGEFLGTVGRLQAEQQKQVQEFRNDVLERAKRAKEKAAREAIEGQGVIPKSTAMNTTSITNGATPASPLTPTNSSSSSPLISEAETDQDPADTGPVLGISNDD
ncbi:hypothetical protein SLE2022_248420 [Rubroshorea leprosula]